MARRLLIGALWLAVVLAVLLGVGAAVLRMVFVSDFAARAEPVRARLISSLEINDPHAAHRPAEVHRFDSRYSAHQFVALLHVVPGGIFLISIWAGWLITLAGAELWIRHTRPR